MNKRDKFYEISRQMARVLRKEIIEDKGTSLLKKKCLDLITNLRLETQLLNDAKTGPYKGRPLVRPVQFTQEQAPDPE